ncbi:hypothetical protein, partial [Ottowia beijingensis]|uniref:hypothetical protein n=1 Tax=Ottowia beijingensis TaxID=1207057 RepID=UPI002FD9DDB6
CTNNKDPEGPLLNLLALARRGGFSFWRLSKMLDYQEVSDDARISSAVWERACPRSGVRGDEAPHRGQARSHNTV